MTRKAQQQRSQGREALAKSSRESDDCGSAVPIKSRWCGGFTSRGTAAMSQAKCAKVIWDKADACKGRASKTATAGECRLHNVAKITKTNRCPGIEIVDSRADAQEKAAEARHKRLVTRALRSLEVRARQPGITLNNPRILGDWFRLRLAEYEHEVFAAAWLDNRLRLIAFEELFRGTYDRTQVSLREVVKAALRVNAAAAAFAHNHPSGCHRPSAEDLAVTIELRAALALVEVRLVDHFVIGATDAVRCVL